MKKKCIGFLINLTLTKNCQTIPLLYSRENFKVWGFDHDILNKKEKAFLIPTVPGIPTIYYLPKVHKDTLHPPSQPIAGGIDFFTSRIGSYIDHYLKSLVRRVPSYLGDTGAIIRRLEGIDIGGDYIMDTADVASLYTCIPHERGIEPVQYFLEKEPSLAPFQCDFIM